MPFRATSIQIFWSEQKVFLDRICVGISPSRSGPLYGLLVLLIVLCGLLFGVLVDFRDLDVMKSQLEYLSLHPTQCQCCDCNHVFPAGLMCDWEIVKEFIDVFGSREAFEITARVCGCSLHAGLWE